MDAQKLYSLIDELKKELGTYKLDEHHLREALTAVEECEQEIDTHFSDAPVVFKDQTYRKGPRWWDEGYGKLWAYSETLGLMGVVRARTWEAAYEACSDEIMHGCTWAELLEECDLNCAEGCACNEETETLCDEAQERAEIQESGNLPEGHGYRSNGEPSNEGIHGEFYSYDLNGQALEELTPELAERLGLIVNVRYKIK